MARADDGKFSGLETNSVLTEARSLYTAHGYRETAPYNDHGAAEHWYAKTLGR